MRVHNIGALMVRIGSCGKFYFRYIKEPGTIALMGLGVHGT